MRWGLRNNHLGVRYFTKFAWLPTLTYNGTVWLERYVSKQTYRRHGERWSYGHEDVCIAMEEGWRTDHLFAQGK